MRTLGAYGVGISDFRLEFGLGEDAVSTEDIPDAGDHHDDAARG